MAGHGRTSGGKGRRGRGTNHYPEGIRLTRRHTFFLVPARSIVDSHLLENFALHALHSHSHFVGAGQLSGDACSQDEYCAEGTPEGCVYITSEVVWKDEES